MTMMSPRPAFDSSSTIVGEPGPVNRRRSGHRRGRGFVRNRARSAGRPTMSKDRSGTSSRGRAARFGGSADNHRRMVACQPLGHGIARCPRRGKPRSRPACWLPSPSARSSSDVRDASRTAPRSARVTRTMEVCAGSDSVQQRRAEPVFLHLQPRMRAKAGRAPGRCPSGTPSTRAAG